MKAKKLLVGIFIIVLSLIFAGIIAEAIFRIYPPKGKLAMVTYDEDIGIVCQPRSRVIYHREYPSVINIANKFGFLDIEHQPRKVPGVKRIAFFGDSYVEALQVPVEIKFFRKLPAEISGVNFEYFGFGISGFGVLQSYLNWKKQDELFNFNIVVYAFTENDIGDNISWITRVDFLPYAVKTDSGSGFEIDDTYKKYDNGLLFLKQLLHKSYFLTILKIRLDLLLRKGIKIVLTKEEEQMATEAEEDAIPNQNNLPSSWPVSVRSYSEQLAFCILKQWVSEVKAKDEIFLLLYIPRAGYLSAKSQADDTWKRWVVSSCADLNVELLDPSEVFLQAEKKGRKPFGDHFTAEGHTILSELITDWLHNNIGRFK